MSDEHCKQIVRVLDAVNEGGETSDQISAMTGLSVATVASYLTVLARDGLVQVVKRRARQFNSRGPLSNVYAPVNALGPLDAG
jgi:transcription initiation factor IIE alpha subunit